jgi:hypothetical protein
MMNKICTFLLLCILIVLGGHVDAEEPVIEYNDDNYKIISNVYSDADFEFNLLKSMDVRNLKIPKCEDITMDITVCKKSICKISSVFGDVIYKIKGSDQTGSCIFVERTTGLGGVDCTISKDELHDVSDQLIQRIKQLRGEKVDSKFDALKSMYGKCKIMEDYKMTSEVQINFDYNSELDPEFNIDNFSDVKVVSVVGNILQSNRKSSPQKSRDNNTEYKSIFF